MNSWARLLLVTALLTGVLAACAPAGDPGLGSPSASPSATPSPAPTASDSPSTPTPAPSVTPSPTPELTWERIDALPGAGDSTAVAAVARGGPGFVAIGYDPGIGTPIWSSPDGRTWTGVPQPPEITTAAMADVTTDGQRLVAVGRGDTTNVEHHVAAAWISEDGAAWRHVADSPELDGGQMIDVIATENGFVAVGGIIAADAAAVWTSPDGEVWQRAGADAPDFEHASMWAVSEGGPGYVAVGWRRNPEPDLAVWTSGDGDDWTLTPELPGAAGFQGRAIAGIDGELVIVGDLVGGGEAAVWRSADGTTWERVASDTFAEASMTDTVVSDGGLVAVGSHLDDAAVWTSADGSSWRLAESEVFADAFLSRAIATPDGVLAVGATQSLVPGTDGSYVWAPAVWLGTRSGVAAP